MPFHASAAALASVHHWMTYLSQLITIHKNDIVPIKKVAARNKSATKRFGSLAFSFSLPFWAPLMPTSAL